ncbi:hypothetical protein [Constantimarinum furrinae]|uniref:Uncharacterized protein n=1 Tax=Constantimarinum furrinae TaxID=2562285 RepID=A0A7G8PUR2_9FLAO|nr:hypothetical protein [Constantimarinum furrinae]QNJ98078.1 hypothetical protein ALE3EI_1520 [Constantimarinum furrinae]
MKTQDTIKVKFAMMAFFIAALTFTGNAQECATTLASKSGTVLSANPGVLTTTATSDQVVVKIRKTGGRAETQVNVYVNNVMQPDPQDVFEFDNGNYTESQYRTRTFNNVSGKTIKVQIVNQSVANTFKYTLKIDGSKKSVATTGGKVEGTLIGQTNKTIYTDGSCTPKTRIIVRRKNGRARGNIRVWEKQSNGSWQRLDQYSQTLEQNQDKKIFVVNSNKKLKVELRNVSVGNTLGYIMNALAAN